MKNLLFMLWMLLYPLAAGITTYIFFRTMMRPRNKEDNMWFNWIVDIIVWFGVGYLLYNN